MLSLREWPVSERPRERLLERGAEALSDAELLALIIGSAGRGSRGVLETCRRLLVEVGGVEKLPRCGVGDLMALPGIGEARACSLMAVAELGRRVWASPRRRGRPLTSSSEAYHSVRSRLAGLPQEVFVVMALGARNQLLAMTQIAQGSATSVEVHPREVFVPLVREHAVAGIVVHNHPSGDPRPSEEDRRLTDRLVQAGNVVGIPILDHLVVGRDDYVSLADIGWL